MPKYSVFKESIKELPFKARMRHYFYQSIVNVKFWISNYHIKIVWCWIVGHDYQSAWGSAMCYRVDRVYEQTYELDRTITRGAMTGKIGEEVK